MIQILATLLPAELQSVGEAITFTVDFEESKANHRTVVMPDVDAKLDDAKRNYDGLSSYLTQAANRIAQDIPEWARQYIESCIYFPQLGFLTVVTLDPDTGKGKYEGEGLDEWERMFVTEIVGYYKNNPMKELDSYFGDMYGIICGMSFPFEENWPREQLLI
jgi:DNA mismatch repair protein MSH5